MKVKIEFLNTQFFCKLTERYVTFSEKNLTVNGHTTPAATKEEIDYMIKEDGHGVYFQETKK